MTDKKSSGHRYVFVCKSSSGSLFLPLSNVCTEAEALAWMDQYKMDQYPINEVFIFDINDRKKVVTKKEIV